jgi:hypothetical protein
MNASRRDMTRLIGIGAAVVIVSVPIALAATTWTPLESSRRDRAISSGEAEGERDAQPGNSESNRTWQRREREPKSAQRGSAPSAASTPDP